MFKTIIFNKMSDNNWIAGYLYYSGSQDEFLKKAVFPFVEILNEKEAYKQFFFIRYFERGTHIRLRFKTDNEIASKIVKPFFVEYFSEYFEKFPSVRMEPDWVKTLPEDQKWFPNNTIHFFEYEPEIERYSGFKGMEISEEHFQICSETVLSALNESNAWNYPKAMGIAMQLMTSFCFAVGMNKEEMIDFFSNYCEMYIGAAIRRCYPSNIIGDNTDYKSKMISVFEEKFKVQKEFYIGLHESLLTSLSENEEFEDEWFNKWIMKNKIISAKLNTALGNNELVIPPYFIENYTKGKKKIYKLFYIMFSYMHMTFNRLGLENKDESFICYIIKESLKNLKN